MKNTCGQCLLVASLAVCSMTGALSGHLALADSLSAPYASSNRNPFVQVYGLPAAQSAQLISQGNLATDFQIELSNSFTEDSKGNESIFIDGESYRSNIRLRYGVSDALELGMDVAYLSHDGGNLDGFIDDWHDFWRLPDGDRPKFPQDQLRYSYQRNGEVLADVTRSSDGLADISFSMAYQLSATASRQWAVRSAVKLPTGDADSLQGSESTDVSLGLHVSDQGLLQNHNIRLHGSAGVLWMSDGDVLDKQREDWVFYGSSTLSWLATPSVSLKLQLDAHSAFYDSRLTELGNNSAQLIFGGAIRLNEKWVIDLALSEDIAVDTAPDVVFHINIKAREW